MNRTVKKYTVNLINPSEDGKDYMVFTRLKLAREEAQEQMRAENFKSLLNFKRIPLPL